MTKSLWLIEENSLATMVDIVNRHLAGEIMSEEEIRIRIQQAENGEREFQRVEIGGGVGIIPLYGPIFPKANLMTELSGATSLENFRSDLRQLLANDRVENIVLDVDSPGGSSQMIQETGEEILAARSIKPIYAVANTLSASAAHWLSSMATEFYSTPSGMVGSIGVYTIHEDVTQRDANEGRKITFIHAGEFKGMLNSHVPLSEEAKAHIQSMVNEQLDTFVDAVAAGRGLSVDKVREFADGRVFTAKDAAEGGLISGVKSLDSLVSELVGGNNPSKVGTALSYAMSAKHDATISATAFASTGNIKAETVEKQHSEPGTQGTNGEPIPRERESEPVRFLPQTDPKSDENNPGGSNIMEESELREILGIGPEADLKESIAELQSVVAEREANAATEAKKAAFAEQYPEEARRLASLEEKDKTTAAKAFAESFTFKSEDGKQFESPLPVTEKLEQAHLACANGNLSMEDFESTLKAVGEAKFIELGERGNSTTPEDVDDETAARNLAKAAEEVSKSENMSYGDALSKVSAEHPEWVEAYNRITTRR